MRDKLFVLGILFAINWIASAYIVGNPYPVPLYSEICDGTSCLCNNTTKVIGVVSGDMLNVQYFGIVKLVGIISPDNSTPEGKKIKSDLENLTLNKIICLKEYAVGNDKPRIPQVVAYLVNTDGTANASKTINLMVLDYSNSVTSDSAIPRNIIDSSWGLANTATP